MNNPFCATSLNSFSQAWIVLADAGNWVMVLPTGLGVGFWNRKDEL